MRMRIVVGLLVCFAVPGCSWWDGRVSSIEVFPPPEVDLSTHITQTADGIALVLHRHMGRKPLGEAPVLLCHSMGYNSNVWDPGPFPGLAPFLARAGYDVWRLDFRGCGLSGPAAPETSLEDYALKDLPAAIAYVARTSQKQNVIVIGHGTGGAAAMIYLLSSKEPPVAGLILIGSPLTAYLPRDAIFADLDLARACLVNPLARYPSIVQRPGGSGTDTPPAGWESLFYNASNMPVSSRDALLCRCSEPIPDGVARQFLRMIATGKLTAPDGKRTYSDELSAIRTPMFTICGEADNFAPPAALRAIFHAIASTEKKFRLFCRANGDGADFGNMDLICGKNVDLVVFPEIAAWLSECAAKKGTP